MNWRKRKLTVFLLLPILIGLGSYGLSSGFLERFVGARLPWRPVLVCPDRLELGERERGTPVTSRIRVANQGPETLRIFDIASSCGCMQLGLETDRGFVRLNSLELQPSEQRELVIRLGVSGQPGKPANYPVRFNSSDPLFPEVLVDIHVSKVKGGCLVRPDCLLVDDAALGQPARRVLEVYDDANPPRTIRGARSTNPRQFKVNILPQEQTESRAQGRVHLIGRLELVVAADEPGILHGGIEIFLSGDVQPPDFVPVVGTVQPQIILAPSAICLPRHTGNGPQYSVSCIVSSADNEPLSLEVESIPPGFSVHVKPDVRPPSRATLDVEWRPNPGVKVESTNLQRVRFTARRQGGETKLELPVLCVAEGDS